MINECHQRSDPMGEKDSILLYMWFELGMERYWNGTYEVDNGLFTFYRMLPEGQQLLHRHAIDTRNRHETLSGGVFADYLDENRDLILSTAVGPDPGPRLDRLIDHLRRRLMEATCG